MSQDLGGTLQSRPRVGIVFYIAVRPPPPYGAVHAVARRSDAGTSECGPRQGTDVNGPLSSPGWLRGPPPLAAARSLDESLRAVNRLVCCMLYGEFVAYALVGRTSEPLRRILDTVPRCRLPL